MTHFCLVASNRRFIFISIYNIDNVFTYDNLIKSAKDCRKGRTWKNNTCLFTSDIYLNCDILKDELRDGTYKHSGYNGFEIFEPKHRLIKSIKYRDKVVQKAFCDNALTPIVEDILIYDNFACRKGKGTHAAIDRTKKFLRRAYFENGTSFYVLKCDVEKYFDSINHDTLINKINRFPLDDELKRLLIDTIKSVGGGIGLPLGNQTSQILSIFYLDSLDKFIKRKLGIKFYLRYMDDFILFSNDKAYLQYCKRRINEHLATLGLSLNDKSNIFPIKNGFDFLGFHFYLKKTGKIIMKVRRVSKERMRRKLKKFEELVVSGEMEAEDVKRSYNSWRGHVLHGDTYYLVKKFDKQVNLILERGNDIGEITKQSADWH